MTYIHPIAVDPENVGDYPALTKSGGGRFYDDVLEYRVWCHPDDGSDYFCAFATHDAARLYVAYNAGDNPEKPLVLVRQLEWVFENEDGVRGHETGERITEWKTEWLEGAKRTEDSVRDFLGKEDD